MESRRPRSIPYRPWIDTGSTLDRPGSTLDRPRIYPTPNRSIPRQFLDERCALEGKKKNELPQVSPRQLLDERCALDKLCNYPKGRISNKVIGPVLI